MFFNPQVYGACRISYFHASTMCLEKARNYEDGMSITKEIEFYRLDVRMQV